MNELHWLKGFTKMTSVARWIGFDTGSVDHVSKENVNKYVGSSWLHKREYLNIVFWSEDVSFKEALIRLFSESFLPLDDNCIKSFTFFPQPSLEVTNCLVNKNTWKTLWTCFY